MMREDFTTHQVCGMLGVARRTLILWIEQGKLDVYKTPGGHRRIRPPDLEHFLSSQGMPIPDALYQKQERLLVIDDDEMTLQIMTRIARTAEQGRFSVLQARNGYEGLLKIGLYHPAILILDLRMPRLDGFEVCRRIRELDELRHIRILACSALSAADCEAEVLAAGADAFVEKPFTAAKFEHFLEAWRTGKLAAAAAPQAADPPQSSQNPRSR